MTKRGLQGLAVGIFFTTALLTYFYFFQTNEVESHEDAEIPEIEISSEEMMDKLAEQGFVVLEEDEYNSLLKAKDEDDLETEQEPQYKGILVVKPGMNSTQVSELLAELNIIDDAQAFIDYLIEQNLTTNVEVGEFELHSDMTFTEIAEIITKKETN